MDLTLLFQQYYFQYRTEAQTPNSSDDEYIIFTGLANEAINRWASYDNTFWKELYNTLQIAQDGDLTLAASTTQYECPGDMRSVGGYVRIFGSNNTTIRRYKIIEPQDVQFQSDLAHYVYFVGDPNNGFTMNINPTPDATVTGQNIDYVYYKKPDLLASGADVPQMSQPYFIVHRALASRFRGSRNPFRNDAKADAEDVLKTMKMENDSGNWANPWQLADHTGGVFGKGYGEGSFL